MMLNVSGTTFIKDAFKGGFCVFEHMATVLSFVDEFILLDMGSTDGTLEICQDIAKKNKRIKIYQEKWTKTNDASAFADVANKCVELCPTDRAYFRQADEINHEKLAKDIRTQYENKVYDMTFERIQLSHNFNQVKWLPHVVCGGLTKNNPHRKYVNDGMTIANNDGCLHMCPFPNVDWHPFSGKAYHGRAFPWHNPKPGVFFDSNNPRILNQLMAEVFPWDSFIVDTSSSFRNNQIGKKELHNPFWHDSINITSGMDNQEWLRRAKTDNAWEVKTSPFPLPKIIQGLVGMTSYKLRDEVRKSLEDDKYGMWGL